MTGYQNYNHIEKLAKHNQERIRLAVARNPKTRQSVLLQLLEDENDRICLATVQNLVKLTSSHISAISITPFSFFLVPSQPVEALPPITRSQPETGKENN